LYPTLPFSPEKDLTPVGLVNTSAVVVVGRKSLPANTLPELIAWMKKNPAKFAHPGTGNTGHLCAALFSQAIGAPVDYIPYRGGGPALQDVIAGHVDLFCSSVQAAIEPVNTGLVKGYGITMPEPLAVLPGVPSLVREVSPKLDIPFWHGLFAPAATPKPVIDKLNAALQELMSDPRIVKLWTDAGTQVYPKEQRTPQHAKAVLTSEIKRWGEVIRENKIEAPQQ
jgi:tripartite-type tricarboxylate transporter receptor subunit TctC